MFINDFKKYNEILYLIKSEIIFQYNTTNSWINFCIIKLIYRINSAETIINFSFQLKIKHNELFFFSLRFKNNKDEQKRYYFEEEIS